MPPNTPTRPDHFIVLVPGFMGSTLRDRRTGRMVWGDFDRSLREATQGNPFGWFFWIRDFLAAMRYPNPNLEAVDLMDEVAFFPPLFKQEHYKRLSAFLKGLGYRVGEAVPEAERTVYEFPYDWRQDNRISGRELAAKLRHWQAHHPGAEAWIIAHSNGGLVARWAIEKEGGKAIAKKMFLAGSPWDGTAVGFKALREGVEMFLRGTFTQQAILRETRAIIQTFPSAFQLIPHTHPTVRFSETESDSPFNHPQWLDTAAARQLLADAKAFNEALGTKSSVPTFCYVGRGVSTLSESDVQRGTDGRWLGMRWRTTREGDGTITARSAAHPAAQEVLTVPVGHSDVYVDPTVQRHLKWQLVGQFGPGERDVLETPTLAISFLPSKSVYTPGETISVVAEIEGAGGAPLVGVPHEVTLRYLQALPGETPPVETPTPVRFTLSDVLGQPGRYIGVVSAPAAQGYYEVKGEFAAPGEPPAILSEVVLIETVVNLDMEMIEKGIGLSEQQSESEGR